ncbi:MAG: hypothetical protein JOY93_07485, partial [Acidobacteriales bacterium]|nr:hypothetical protein [Terriglobales bacterium]
MSSSSARTQNQLPPDQLPVPQSMTGIGNSHIKITAKPEAQMWFDQGLNLIDDFWDYESARAFEQSIRADPQCAMCYWGLHKAESFYHGTSQGYAGPALAKAMALRTHASKRERLYIEATAAYLKLAQLDKFEEGRAEQLRRLRKLVNRYPEEIEARIALADAMEDGFDDAGEPRSGQKQALAQLESVLKDDPNNSAANHLYIHALEASAHPERALHSAEVLLSLAPNSGHMVHMPGHIFYRMGDYARAEDAFEASFKVDERYLKEQHVPPDNDWNYVHNLMYSVANLLESGKFKKATALSAKLSGARGQFDSTLYSFSSRDSISRLNPQLPVLLRLADWRGIIESLTGMSTTGLPNLDFLAQELSQFAAGMDAVEKKDLAQANQASLHLDAELWRMGPQSKDTAGYMGGRSAIAPANPPQIQLMPDALLHPLLDYLSVMSLELRACLLTAEKHGDEAKKLFSQAQKQE